MEFLPKQRENCRKMNDYTEKMAEAFGKDKISNLKSHMPAHKAFTPSI